MGLGVRHANKSTVFGMVPQKLAETQKPRQSRSKNQVHADVVFRLPWCGAHRIPSRRTNGE